MCGRLVWVWDPETGLFFARYIRDAPLEPDVRQALETNRYNVPPTSRLPVIAGLPGGPRVLVARWGLAIPHNASGAFNARIEGARDSPLWRGLLGRSHCLFVVKGFYEWRRGKLGSVPHFIRRSDGAPMLLAGLIAKREWNDRPEWCASIVTCPPNEALSTLHDRMPVVLEQPDAEDWLAPERAGFPRVLELAVPAGDVLAVHEVGPAVNDAHNDDPRLLEPVQAMRWF